jgi:large subunit ribosomal protein L17
MKKKVFGRKLSRERDTRRALFRSLIAAFVRHGRIKTTKAKAKAVQPAIDKLVNIAKDGSQSSLRRLYALLGNNKEATKSLFEIAKLFKDRKSGYTRIINLGSRRGDAAQMTRLEWVKEVKVQDAKDEERTKKKEERTKKKKVATKQEVGEKKSKKGKDK